MSGLSCPGILLNGGFEDIGSVNLDCDAEIVQLQMKGGCTSVPQVLNQEEQAQYC